MAAPIVVRFQVDGVDTVERAFRKVEDAVIRSERSSTTEAMKGTRTRLSEAERETRDKQRMLEREAREKIAAMKSADRIILSAQKQTAREFETMEREKNREAMKWVREREREEIASMRRVATARERFNRTVGHATMQGISTGARWGGGLATTALSLGGGFSIADAVQGRMAAQGMAADISNSGYQPNGDKAANRVRRSSNDVLNSASAAGIPQGFSQEETLKGLSAFTAKTGDLDMGTKSLGKLAELARATGASFEDVANAAAEVFNSDTSQSMEDMMTTLRGIAGQGKLGAVEIKDLAVQMSKITASAGMFGGNKAENVITLGAMAQNAKAHGGATSAAEAATSVARFGSDVAKGTSKFKALGIETKNKDGTLRGPEEIIKDSLKATGGDVSKLSHLFGERSVKSVLGSAETYRNAGGNSSDPKKQEVALNAVTAEFTKLRSAAMSEAEVKESAEKRMQEADMLFAKVMLELRDTAAKELLPALVKLAPALGELVPYIAEAAKAIAAFAEFTAKNPFLGMGAILGAAVAKEVAGAALQKSLESAIGSSLGKAGLIIGSAVIAVEIGKMVIDSMVKDENRPQDQAIKDQKEAAMLTAKIKRGDATPDEIRRAGVLGNDLKNDADSVEKNQAEPGAVKNLAYKAMGLVDPEQEIAARTADKENSAATAKQTREAHDQLIKALKDNTTATLAATKTDAKPGPPANRSEPIGSPQRP